MFLAQAAGFVLLVLCQLASAAEPEGLEEWQREFLVGLESVYQAGEPVSREDFAEYTAHLRSSTAEELLQTVEERVVLQPYNGSMVDPTAALMGGHANALDRARLLHALLDTAGFESRIMGVTTTARDANLAYPASTPAPLEPIAPDFLYDLELQVQSLAPRVWQALCGDLATCEEWQATLSNHEPQSMLYWVQVFDSGTWSDLVHDDTPLAPSLMTRGQFFTDEDLQAQSWRIRISVSNQFADGVSPEIVLDLEFPAASLHAQPVSYDNVPVEGGGSFVPTLAVGDRPLIQNPPFSLSKQGQTMTRQLIHVEVNGPHSAHRFSRELATPLTTAQGLELVSRARITVLTGPLWEQLFAEHYDRAMARLANLLYADGSQKDPRPLNLASFRAFGLLQLSHRLAGQVGLASTNVLVYQSRPAVLLERDYPLDSEDEIQLRTGFDILDAGHANSCDGCLDSLRLKAAVEQSVVDGLLEDWITGGEGSVSSYELGIALLDSGVRLQHQRPDGAAWKDIHNGRGATYRLGNIKNQLTGWRLDPGPQVIPILTGGAGGAVSSATTGATSGFIRNFIKHATSKCGASDIGGSVILALAGAPMTGPLLSGIVGHMCRVAEAYNKAAGALNCLEFMGNDCSATAAANELENMLKGLGDALATDLALAQATDILAGAVIEGVVSPAIRNALRQRWARTPRARMPPPRDFVMPPSRPGMPPPSRSVMPPGRSAMPRTGDSVMPPGRSVMPPRESVMPPGRSAMPPAGESAMPPGKSAMPPRDPAMPPRSTADDDYVPDEFVEEILDEVDEVVPDVPRFTGDHGRQVRSVIPGEHLDTVPVTVTRGTDAGPKPKPLVARQDHVYADDISYHMGQMERHGDDYVWGTGPYDRIKADPETGLILDGHHRVYAAGRLGRDIPADQIQWTPKTNASFPTDDVVVRPGPKPRSDVKYPDRADDPFDFRFDLGD